MGDAGSSQPYESILFNDAAVCPADGLVHLIRRMPGGPPATPVNGELPSSCVDHGVRYRSLGKQTKEMTIDVDALHARGLFVYIWGGGDGRWHALAVAVQGPSLAPMHLASSDDPADALRELSEYATRDLVDVSAAPTSTAQATPGKLQWGRSRQDEWLLRFWDETPAARAVPLYVGVSRNPQQLADDLATLVP